MQKIIGLILSFSFLCNTLGAQCLGTQIYTLTPAGPYSPGQTVIATYTLNSWIQVNANWVHCFDLDLGPGWSTVTPISAPGNPVGSNGNWIWDNQHTYSSGINFGPGWRFNNTGWAPYGTVSQGPFTMSFELTVSQNCTPQNLYIYMETYGDCQTGGWWGGGCCPIVPYEIYTGNSIGNGVVNLSSTITNISCFGSLDGSIILGANGGLPPNTYLWSTGATTQNINNLHGGNYSVTVTDAAGCVSTLSNLIITEPPAISVLESTTNVSCNGGNNGTATLTLSGGTGTLTVDWFGMNPTALPPGTYNYTVTDLNGCIYADDVTITEPPAINVSAVVTDITCYGDDDGTATLTLSGGTGTLTVNWFGMDPTALPPGTHNYTVTDTNGCIYADNVTITEPPAISVSVITTNVSCNGGNNGTATLTLSGGTGTLTVDWFGMDPTALSAGTHNYTVTDINGCIYSNDVTITEPPAINVLEITTNVSCNGGTNGTATLTLSGGTGTLTVDWFGMDPTALAAGTHNYTVTDLNGCIYFNDVTITEPPAISVLESTTNVSCNGGTNGIATLTLSGSTGTLTVDWFGMDPTALAAGTHNYTVTDINGCIYADDVTITEPPAISVSAVVTDITCYGDDDGTATLTLSGGTGTLTINWFSMNPTALPPGTHNYTITDINGCIYADNVTITEPAELLATSTTTNVNCNGGNTGTATLNISGGTTPYNENWGTANPNALFDGTYIYIVTDDNGCTLNNQIIISEPDILISTIATTDAICFGYNNGTAIITTNGGTQPYNTNWFGQNNLVLTSGNYSTLITDANGCTNTINFSISEPSEISVIIDSFQTTCFGYSDGSALLTISGGFPPFTENWFGQNNLALAAGNHNFEVIDSNNCIHQGIATIYQPLNITTNEITSDVLCNGESNGTAFLQIFGGTSPYSENWNGANILQLTVGNYTYTITDANNCTFTDYVSINEPASLSVQETVTDANCFNSNDGQVILNINGGTTPYSEDWGGDNPFALSAGVYYYTVSDLNSCSFSDSVLINQSNEIFMNFSVESPICIFDTSKVTISIINPNSESYTIEINDGTITTNYLVDSLGLLIPLENQITFNPESSRVITIVSITDENGCTSSVNQTDSIIVNPLPVLSLDIPNFCTQDTSRIINQAIPTGGIYFIDNKQTNFFDIENMEVETYNIRYEYTDPMTGCFNTISTDIQINESPYADFAFGPQPANIDDPEIYFENRSDFYNYQLWDLGDGTIINQDEFSHIFPDTGSFFTQLYIKNEYGCSDSITYKIIIYPVFAIYIPSAFTPNDDGDNDTFGPVLRDGGYQSYNMKIFNQWGEIIFDQENTFWNGTLNNELCQHGAYTYTIIVYDFLNKPYSSTGSFILIK